MTSSLLHFTQQAAPTFSSTSRSSPPPVVVNNNMHTFEAGNTQFTLDKRYSFNKVVGKGAYGVVISCFDSKTNNNVAIKKVPRAFEDLTDSKRVLRELMLLQHLSHENTVKLLNILPPPNSTIEEYQDIYMVMELMETDLNRIIHSQQTLTDEHVQFFLIQILRALKYIHSTGVLHRDLKPSNLLVNSSCDLKICDFGLARGINENEVVLTEYVVTRWYRAPEVMLSSKTYTYGVDVWSTGCILAELLLRKPLFQGDDYIHQLQLINDVLGNPNEEEMHFISSDKAKRFIRSLKKAPAQFDSIFAQANPMAVDLLKKMLSFDPWKRISIDEALAHPYLQEFINSEETPPPPTTHSNKTPFEFEYEHQHLDVDMLRELMWKEMSNFNPEAKRVWEERRKDGKMKIDKVLLKVVTPSSSSMSSSTTSSSGTSGFPTDDDNDSKEERKRVKNEQETITPTKNIRMSESRLSSHEIVKE